MIVNFGELEAEVYNIPEFTFESGERLENLKVEYISYGKPHKNSDGLIDNLILYIHGWSGDYGSLQRIDAIMGEDGVFDPEEFFFICISSLGSPGSASPSSTGLYKNFPEYTVTDMVNFQRQFLREKFNVTELVGVIGNSMGGFQTIDWACRYPEEMKFILPLVSTYQIKGHNYALFNFMNQIIETDPDYIDNKRPERAIQLAYQLMYSYGLSLKFYREEMSNQEIHDSLKEIQEDSANVTAEDIVWRNNAANNYDDEQLLTEIKAKTIIVAINQDQHFPPELNAIPLSKLIPESHLITYDSELGHIGTIELDLVSEQLKKHLKEFKKQ